MFVLAISIHHVEETIVLISHELAFCREPLQRLSFQNAFVAAQIIEDLALKNEKAGARGERRPFRGWEH